MHEKGQPGYDVTNVPKKEELMLMRVPLKLLMAAALLAPVGMVASSATTAGAAGGTSCAHSSGVATFTPPLPKLGSSQTVVPIITVKGAKVTNCVGGGVTSGTFKSKVTFHDATNCEILLSGNPSPNPPTGKIITTWNTGQQSTGKIKLLPVTNQPTETHVKGVVKLGLFAGLKIDQTLSFTPKTGDCTSTDLSQVSFTEVTPLTIS